MTSQSRIFASLLQVVEPLGILTEQINHALLQKPSKDLTTYAAQSLLTRWHSGVSNAIHACSNDYARFQGAVVPESPGTPAEILNATASLVYDIDSLIHARHEINSVRLLGNADIDQSLLLDAADEVLRTLHTGLMEYITAITNTSQTLAIHGVAIQTGLDPANVRGLHAYHAWHGYSRLQAAAIKQELQRIESC